MALAVRHPLEPVLQPDLSTVARLTPARFETISTQIGYRFTDRQLLVTALSHASAQKKHGDNERLEFLGDRVLALVIAEELFKLHPDQREGALAARHSALVRTETCAEAGALIGIAGLVMVGSSEQARGMTSNPTLQGDAMEALIAAIYLDGGLEAARSFILSLWRPFFAEPGRALKDAKTFLQEWALARALPIPNYRIMSRAGPEHAPVFVVVVEVKGMALAEGSASSKRAAEQRAAAEFLAREGIRANGQQ